MSRVLVCDRCTKTDKTFGAKPFGQLQATPVKRESPPIDLCRGCTEEFAQWMNPPRMAEATA